MTSSTTEFLTFIPSESRSQAAQEAIRVHVLRRRHQQQRESRRVYGKDRGPVAHHGGHFQIWQADIGSQESGLPSPDSLHHQSPDPSNDLKSSIQGEGGDCMSPSDDGVSVELENNTPEDLGLDRRSVEELLIQYYLLAGATPIAYEWLESYRQSPATFNAFLAMVAARLSDEQGRNPLLDPAELENKALQELSRQISLWPEAPACDTIRAMILLAYLNDGQHLACHWKALMEMIRLNGGLHSLRTHRDLYAYVFWGEGVAIDRCPQSLGDLAPSQLAATNPKDAMQQLRQFLQGVNARLAEQVSAGDTPPSKLTSPVLVSLQKPPNSKVKYIYDKWCRAKLVCLVYFATLSLQSETRLMDDPQYRAVELEVLSRERSYPVSPDELYYITIQVANQDHTCELTWTVARLVHAIKELEHRDRNTCYRLLALYLGFQDSHVTKMVSEESDELSERLLSMPGKPKGPSEDPSDQGESYLGLGSMYDIAQ